MWEPRVCRARDWEQPSRQWQTIRRRVVRRTGASSWSRRSRSITKKLMAAKRSNAHSHQHIAVEPDTRRSLGSAGFHSLSRGLAVEHQVLDEELHHAIHSDRGVAFVGTDLYFEGLACLLKCLDQLHCVVR